MESDGMTAWIALLAAVAGGSIAIAGQYVIGRSERITRRAELVLDQCAQLIALSEDFRNRLWEERVLGLKDRTTVWDLHAFRLAEARLRILCGDPKVLAALNNLNSSGKALGAYWRRGEINANELGLRYEQNKAAVEGFVAASAQLVRRRLGAL
jgi:hypothetical protein